VTGQNGARKILHGQNGWSPISGGGLGGRVWKRRGGRGAGGSIAYVQARAPSALKDNQEDQQHHETAPRDGAKGIGRHRIFLSDSAVWTGNLFKHCMLTEKPRQ